MAILPKETHGTVRPSRPYRSPPEVGSRPGTDFPRGASRIGWFISQVTGNLLLFFPPQHLLVSFLEYPLLEIRYNFSSGSGEGGGFASTVSLFCVLPQSLMRRAHHRRMICPKRCVLWQRICVGPKAAINRYIQPSTFFFHLQLFSFFFFFVAFSNFRIEFFRSPFAFPSPFAHMPREDTESPCVVCPLVRSPPHEGL